ncbi:uncharacterized protein LOC103313351 [Tribolium castaneum]|uniref:uncharacterized protein LOC103313351 n=1 Tax=Tribolium castaneum TaxID=7070 RepID=UPI0030FF0727
MTLKDREIYTATKGVENEGYEFEIAMLLFYCLDLSYNTQIRDFKIAIYDNEFHPFDDIVIDVSTETTVKYAIQLKHVKDKLILSSHHFGRNGKMVLNKYFKFDFTKSDHVVLFTNGVLNEEMSISGCDIKAKKTLTFLEQCLDTSPSTSQHIYEVSNEETKNKITFFTSQKNRNEIDAAIRTKLEEKFKLHEKNLDSVVQKLKFFLQQWKKGHYKLYKLDKQDIKMKLAEILLQDSLVQLCPNFGPHIDPKILLLQDVIKSRTITTFEKPPSGFDTLFCFDLDKNKLIEDGQELLVGDLDEETKIGVILWRLKIFPLVVKTNEENKQVIREVITDLRDENLNYILLGGDSPDFDQTFKLLRNLSDLKNSQFYDEIVRTFKLSIQGRAETTLEELIAWNPNFSQIVTTRELFLMARGDLHVGEPQEVLPQPYIPRRLFFPVLKIKTIGQFPSDLFAIIGREDVLKKALPKNTFFRFDDCVGRTFIGGKLPPKSVILCRDEKDLRNCLGYKNSNVHCLKALDGENLQLLFSKEKGEELRQFQIFPENQLTLLPNKIKLVVARPGLGKLTMLKFLKNNAPVGHWAVKVDLQEEVGDHGEGFEFQVKNCFKEVNRWVYFYCGIDNLQNGGFAKACQEIREKSGEFQVWVFSEDHLKEQLEKCFEVPAMEIEEFTEEEQQEYITKRLEERQKVAKVLQSFKMLRNNDILGAPMHLYMLTEIFINDPKMEQVLILTEIYRYFINTKYQHYRAKTCDTCESNHNQIIEDGIFYRNEQYKLAAISCLDVPSFKKLKLTCDSNFLTQIKSRGDVIGVIFKVSSDHGIIFTQQTFSDYFAAIWLAEHHQNVGPEFLQRDDLRNILFMFNLEVCKNHPAHISVLYQNLQELEKHQLGDLDPLKRSVLHLSFCHGPKFSKIQREIFDLLVQKAEIDPFQKDELFNWDLLDYAFNLGNFHALERLLGRFATVEGAVLGRLCMVGDLEPLVYYCVKFGCENLLKLASKTPNFGSHVSWEDSNGESLLYLAAKSGSCANTSLLLDQGARIDCATSSYNKMSALHAAVENNCEKIVDLLLKRQAFVDVMDRYRNTPLHLAASKGLQNCAKTLLNFGADVNFSDNFGRTPLQLAASSGHHHLVELFLGHGALIDKSDKLGNTPFSAAFGKKHRKICDLLANLGAKNDRKPSVGEVDQYYILFPLHWVVFTGQLAEIKSLLDEGYSIDEVDHFGRTPLHRAVIGKHQKAVEVFLDRGADVTICDNYKIMPLTRAIFNEDAETTKLLVFQHASVDFKDSFGYTPLHLAAMCGNVEIVKLLLTKNPDFDVCDDFGRKPVDCAVEGGHSGVVALLGGDEGRVGRARQMARFLEVRDTPDLGREELESFGFSFKHLVAMLGRFEDLERFVDEEDFVDVCGNTALDWACKKGHVECVKVLVGCRAVAKAIQGDFLDMARKQREFYKVLDSY